jgi:tetratricopeptide (TPR) repeat protein
MFAVASAMAAAAAAEPVLCPGNLWYPGGACPSAAPSPPPQPVGPSSEEKEEMRQQAFGHANNAGIAAFRRGDYKEAIRDFEEALEYSPYNPTVKHNLEKARERLADQQKPQPDSSASNSAFGQLNAAAASSNSAASADDSAYSGNLGGTAGAGTASRQFDTPTRAPPIPLRFVKYLEPNSDPVVPARRETPRVRQLEKQREQARGEAKKLDIRRTTLDPDSGSSEQKQQQAKVVAQEKAQLEKIQHLDFSIKKELELH